ncbi:hypothetical protein PL321_07010 [Caloramator sp. mosi_1]|uniref:hypothetical protein n=1 Tax=Caloramator sp. mosi_1 TaxID=3023090 RepID=UPI00235E6C50|nr:hypothetical protein [Caloramator sp. mosi_1]WDC85205.1 hypothetical protein PL321_07010 [Caloramator sp. mosi_1]
MTIYNAFSKISKVFGCSLRELRDDFYKITNKNIFKVQQEITEINSIIDKFKYKYEDIFNQVLFSFRDFVPTCYIIDENRNDYVNVDIITALNRFINLEPIEEKDINDYLDKQKSQELKKKIKKDKSSITILKGVKNEKVKEIFILNLIKKMII